MRTLRGTGQPMRAKFCASCGCRVDSRGSKHSPSQGTGRGVCALRLGPLARPSHWFPDQCQQVYSLMTRSNVTLRASLSLSLFGIASRFRP
ncbi:protein of unknown function [Cupriavidus taiwanensis]|nr:protein of unknown function [Cupriavidus taiwanensis]